MEDSVSKKATKATIEVNRSREALSRLSLGEALSRLLLDDKDRISQDRLEKFVNGKYHWRALTPTDQMKVARELYLLRQSYS